MNVIYLFKTFFQNSFYFLSLKYDDAFFFFQRELGWSVWGSLGQTKITGGCRIVWAVVGSP